MLFACRASPCSPLPTLPGAASAVLASSPSEACCFRFFFNIFVPISSVNQSECKYARNWVVKQVALFPCAFQVNVSNPAKMYFLVCHFFFTFFVCLAPCVLSQPSSTVVKVALLSLYISGRVNVSNPGNLFIFRVPVFFSSLFLFLFGTMCAFTTEYRSSTRRT